MYIIVYQSVQQGKHSTCSEKAKYCITYSFVLADENIDISHGRNSTDVILKEQCDLVHHSGTTTHHFMNGLQELPSISAGNEADTSARRTDSADNCTAKMNDKHKWAPVSDMDEVWQNILGRIHSPYLKEFLLQQGKLVSLTVSRGNALFPACITQNSNHIQS